MAIVDTNVFISHLSLLKGLVAHLAVNQTLDLTIVIPGVVLHELDRLKLSNKEERVTRPDNVEEVVQLKGLAINANKWLHEQVAVKKMKCIRVQKDSETNLKPSWRMFRQEVRE